MKQLLLLACLSAVWSGLASCKKQCQDNCNRPEACALAPDPGDCQAAFVSYYYDAQEGRCKQTYWGGCGGVRPFTSLEACQACECTNSARAN